MLEILNNMETPDILIPVGIWAILSLIVGIIGVSRRIGFVKAFLCSIFFTPFVGIIVAMITKNRHATN